MSNIRKTEHARMRMQQRGIGDLKVKLLKEFGVDQCQKGGECLTYIPAKMIAELRHAIDKLANVMLVLGDDDLVVTAMHVNKRLHKTHYRT
jgi:hypothetical protein